MTIIDKLKGSASLIHTVGSLCLTECLVNWADWIVAQKSGVSVEKDWAFSSEAQ